MTVNSSANGSKPQRLFFALWPEPVLQQQLYALAQPVLEQARGGRRTPAENLHLTLVFLGSMDADVRVCLEQRVEEIRVPSFELEFDRLGFFRRGRILWAGTARVPLALFDLVNALKAAQAACGRSPENREYEAHITLVRDLRRCPPTIPVTPVGWPARQFALVRAVLSAGGSRYEVLRTWRLIEHA